MGLLRWGTKGPTLGTGFQAEETARAKVWGNHGEVSSYFWFARQGMRWNSWLDLTGGDGELGTLASTESHVPEFITGRKADHKADQSACVAAVCLRPVAGDIAS